jgi:hypothetical protein
MRGKKTVHPAQAKDLGKEALHFSSAQGKGLVTRRAKKDGLIAILFMEAAPGFEPGNRGFADRCLTAWLCRLKMERETGFEPATSTLARLHSTAELFPHFF